MPDRKPPKDAPSPGEADEPRADELEAADPRRARILAAGERVARDHAAILRRLAEQGERLDV